MLKVWVNIRSGNGLVPVGAKPLPELMLTYRQSVPLAFFIWEMLKMAISEMCFKIVLDI